MSGQPMALAARRYTRPYGMGTQVPLPTAVIGSGDQEILDRASEVRTRRYSTPPGRPFVMPVGPVTGALTGWIIAAISGRSKKGTAGYPTYRAKRKKFALTGAAVGIVAAVYNGAMLTSYANRVRAYEAATGEELSLWG